MSPLPHHLHLLLRNKLPRRRLVRHPTTRTVKIREPLTRTTTEQAFTGMCRLVSMPTLQVHTTLIHTQILIIITITILPTRCWICRHNRRNLWSHLTRISLWYRWLYKAHQRRSSLSVESTNSSWTDSPITDRTSKDGRTLFAIISAWTNASWRCLEMTINQGKVAIGLWTPTLSICSRTAVIFVGAGVLERRISRKNLTTVMILWTTKRKRPRCGQMHPTCASIILLNRRCTWSTKVANRNSKTKRNIYFIKVFQQAPKCTKQRPVKQ